ncbi:MAG: tetratricopeptide repeat protein [Ignavibacteria bacterium]
MAKSVVKKKRKSEPSISFDLNYKSIKTHRIVIYIGIALFSFFLSLLYVKSALDQNGYFGFPLDDPWIHLTFAKNLVNYHSFSYYKNEMVTAGSTSPLYTLILSVLYVVNKNEMIISYFLGIMSFLLASLMFYKLADYEFPKENIYALLATLIFVTDKWMNFISVSGMETSMFILALLVTTYYYRKNNFIMTGVFLGLILWLRPDGLTFILALLIDYAIRYYLYRRNKSNENLFTRRDFLKLAGAFSGIVVLYLLMNLWLSGTLLPNTYNAKLAYYSPEFKSRTDFLELEVFKYFTKGEYLLIGVGFIFGVLDIGSSLKQKKYHECILYVVFIFTIIFVYWYKLPYAHRFGRYLMPVIPFYILTSVIGFKYIAIVVGRLLHSRRVAIWLMMGGFIISILWSFSDYVENKKAYANECKYINDRQVVTAKWLRDNTNENDIIATHDVGAIGFYSDRKIVDIAGLVTPEVIKNVGDTGYVSYMEQFMKQQGVTYLAFLKEWYRVSNQNPVFSSFDLTQILISQPGKAVLDRYPGETMEVYKFYPDKTIILSKKANSLNTMAQELLTQNNIAMALRYLEESLRSQPNAAVTYFIVANAFLLTGDMKSFESNLKKALYYFPEYNEANIELAMFYKVQNNCKAAAQLLKKVVLNLPNNKKVQDVYNSLPDSCRVFQ